MKFTERTLPNIIPAQYPPWLGKSSHGTVVLFTTGQPPDKDLNPTLQGVVLKKAPGSNYVEGRLYQDFNTTMFKPTNGILEF